MLRRILLLALLLALITACAPQTTAAPTLSALEPNPTGTGTSLPATDEPTPTDTPEPTATALTDGVIGLNDPATSAETLGVDWTKINEFTAYAAHNSDYAVFGHEKYITMYYLVDNVPYIEAVGPGGFLVTPFTKSGDIKKYHKYVLFVSPTGGRVPMKQIHDAVISLMYLTGTKPENVHIAALGTDGLLTMNVTDRMGFDMSTVKSDDPKVERNPMLLNTNVEYALAVEYLVCKNGKTVAWFHIKGEDPCDVKSRNGEYFLAKDLPELSTYPESLQVEGMTKVEAFVIANIFYLMKKADAYGPEAKLHMWMFADSVGTWSAYDAALFVVPTATPTTTKAVTPMSTFTSLPTITLTPSLTPVPSATPK